MERHGLVESAICRVLEEASQRALLVAALWRSIHQCVSTEHGLELDALAQQVDRYGTHASSAVGRETVPALVSSRHFRRPVAVLRFVELLEESLEMLLLICNIMLGNDFISCIILDKSSDK